MATPLLQLVRMLPTRTALATVVGLLWALSFGAVRDFVWADLRQGMISLHGLSRPTRALVWIGFMLLIAMLGALLLSHHWRAAFELVALSSSLTTAGRGSLVPAGVIPLTLFLMAMAWSFALAGALHARGWVRLGVLTLYLLTAAGWIHFADPTFRLWHLYTPGAWQLLQLLAGWTLLLAVPALFWLRRRAEAQPALEFCLLLLLVGATLLLAQARLLERSEQSQIPVLLAMLEMSVELMIWPVIFFMLLIGVEIALLARQVGVWTAEIAQARLSRSGAQLLLALVLGWQLWSAGAEAAERMAREGVLIEMLQYARALSVPLAVLLVWWLVTRFGALARSPDPQADSLAAWVKRWAFPLILLFNAVSLASVLATLFLQSLPQAAPTMALQSWWTGAIDTDPLTLYWRLSLNLAALAGAAWMARRGEQALAVFLGTLGVLHLWWWATHPGRLLHLFNWSGPEPLAFWWVVIFTGFALLWALRGQLTAGRAAGLLALAVMAWLLRQTALLDDPFTPFFFGYSGIGFIACGILWDIVSAGSWANESTPRLPRISRVLLYVGYALLVVAVANWILTTHNQHYVGSLTGAWVVTGLENFGKPLLFAVFALTLAALAQPEAEAASARERPAEIR